MHSSTRIQPKFSIITVTYNAGNVLERTIQSIINQTYKHVEYIIIDGKSTDRTLDIINQYKNDIHQFVCEADQGLYDAMNKGIRLAKGDYLCFLNAGDTLHENGTLHSIANSIHTSNLPDIIYGETAIVDSEGHFLHMRKKSAPERLNWRSFKKGMLVCHQAFFASRMLAQQEMYDLSYRFSADFDWCIQVMKKSKTFHHTHLILIDYLNEGMTTQNHKASLKERFRIMVKHYGWISTLWNHLLFAIQAFLPDKGNKAQDK